jgi:hypothetical protein
MGEENNNCILHFHITFCFDYDSYPTHSYSSSMFRKYYLTVAHITMGEVELDDPFK